MWRRRLTFIASVMLVVVFATLWLSTYWVHFDSGYVMERPYVSVIGSAAADQRLLLLYTPSVDVGARENVWFGNSRWLTVRILQFAHGGSIVVSIHWWIVTLISVVISLWAFCDVRRARRLLRQLGKVCHRCGYDLRGSEGKCRECGEEIPKRLEDSEPAERSSADYFSS
jgi:hypothetical protein